MRNKFLTTNLFHLVDRTNIAVLKNMRYAKFCEGQLFARRLSLPPETSESLSTLAIPNYQLPITHYPLPDIPHLYEKGYMILCTALTHRLSRSGTELVIDNCRSDPDSLHW